MICPRCGQKHVGRPYKVCFDCQRLEREAEKKQSEDVLHCPRCGSTNWRCWDETSRPCWDKQGFHMGDRVIGMLACNDCGLSWADYSVDPQIGDPDCECDEY